MSLNILNFYMSHDGITTCKDNSQDQEGGWVYFWKRNHKVYHVGATWLHPAARAEKHASAGKSGEFEIQAMEIDSGNNRGRIRDILAHAFRHAGHLSENATIGQSHELQELKTSPSKEEQALVDAIVKHAFPTWVPPTLRSDRLVLRPIRESDADDVFAYASKENVTRYVFFDRHKSIDDAQFFIKEIAHAYYREQEPEPYAITMKGDDRLIGTCGCFEVSEGVMEMGYVLDDKYWGQGIIPEAGRAIVDHVFSNYTVDSIRCRANNKNSGSKRVMEKIGFKFDGLLRSALKVRGEYWDMHMTSLLRSDWEATKRSP